MKFTWKRYGGYEVSSKGDVRFSAMFAKLPDGRTIEMHYQCDIKGYQPGGTNWRLGKGRPSLRTDVNLWEAYLDLWRTWALAHPELMEELRLKALGYDGLLSDRFATTRINQARALAHLLTEMQEYLSHDTFGEHPSRVGGATPGATGTAG